MNILFFLYKSQHFLLVYNLAPFIWHQISKLFVLLYEQIPHAGIESVGIHYILVVSVIAIFLILAPILFAAMLLMTPATLLALPILYINPK